MKTLVLFILFCTIFSVQSNVSFATDRKIIEVGDQVSFFCNMPLAKWAYKGKLVAQCEHCPSSSCNVIEYFKKQIAVSCSQNLSILHFNSTGIDDNFGELRCPPTSKQALHLFVGKYDSRIYPEDNSTSALDQKDFTLVCDMKPGDNVMWINDEAQIMRSFDSNCSTNDLTRLKKFHFTCDKKQLKSKLRINNVTKCDNGLRFGCFLRTGHISMFRLIVKVPDEKIHTNSTIIKILAFVIAVLAITTTIMGGYIIFQRSPMNNRKDNVVNKLKFLKVNNSENTPVNKLELPKANNEKNIPVNNLVVLKGQDNRTLPVYLELLDRSPASGSQDYEDL